MQSVSYIHGTEGAEQERLALLNHLTNAPFIRFLELEETASVLEVGSGLGILTQEVARRVPKGRAIGVEYSAEQLRRASLASVNLHFVQGDAHHLPFDEESFDTVYCRYLLEHVREPVIVLKEIGRVLVPGGRAFAQENNILVNVFYPECPLFDAIWQKFAVLQERLGGDALIGKRLLVLFREAGFHNVELSIQPEIHHAGTETFRPWIENQIGNVEGCMEEFQKRHLATEDEIIRAIEELRAFVERDDASAIFYWNRASGVKL